MNESSQEQNDGKTIGRNEPCPCNSGKKYKRCCGVAAAPKLSVSKKSLPGFPSEAGGLDPQSALEGMNPEILMQFTQALQRLPKAQIQRFQTLMQKAMSGKDVTQEAAEFEKTLPLEFQTLVQSMGAMGMGGLGGGVPDANSGFDLGGLGLSAGKEAFPALEAPQSEPLSEKEARALVAKAAAEGKISKAQADALLQVEPQLEAEIIQSAHPETSESGSKPDAQSSGSDQESKFKKLWKNISKK